MKFQTMAEVNEYLSGNRIQCLVCGKYFLRLQCLHLRTHGMTADQYREEFGILWNRSLTSAPSRKATSLSMTPERIAAFKAVLTPKRNHNRRPNAPAVRNAWKQNAVLGRVINREPVITGCMKCGAPVQTTRLCAVQPIYCDQCITRNARKVREYNRRKRAA
jgi:hypothetical protein